jgi:dihydrolipoamide dehydrogenase
LTEREARNEGYEVGIGRQDFDDQGKPKALRETEGFVKLVTDAETDELLGAHVVGEQGPKSSTNSSSPSNWGRQPNRSPRRCTSTPRSPRASTRPPVAFTNPPDESESRSEDTIQNEGYAETSNPAS